MKAIVEKKIEIIRNSHNSLNQTVDYIGMNKRTVTICVLSIPIYQRVELFCD
ncbi:MAG: hypothetical protein H6Q13_3337 [Bacteroidetes bacterium]|nr:hypothetical protein [Bacteroidota bacterium]